MECVKHDGDRVGLKKIDDGKAIWRKFVGYGVLSILEPLYVHICATKVLVHKTQGCPED